MHQALQTPFLLMHTGLQAATGSHEVKSLLPCPWLPELAGVSPMAQSGRKEKMDDSVLQWSALLLSTVSSVASGRSLYI